MINGNRIYLSSISSLIAKGLNTYGNKVFLPFILNTFAKMSKPVFALSLWGTVNLLMREKNYLKHFRIWPPLIKKKYKIIANQH